MEGRSGQELEDILNRLKLDGDETVVWSGQPERQLMFQKVARSAKNAVLLAAIAIFLFPTVFVVPVVLGTPGAITAVVLAAIGSVALFLLYQNGVSEPALHYLITDRRAIIVRKLKPVDIASFTTIDLKPPKWSVGSNGIGDLNFGPGSFQNIADPENAAYAIAELVAQSAKSPHRS